MQKDMDKTSKDIIIEGVRFTPEMLADISIDKEKLLREIYADTKGVILESNHERPKIHNPLFILLRIIGLGVLAILFYSFDHLALKATIGIIFIILLIETIYSTVNKDSDQKLSINISEDALLKYVGYAFIIGLGLLAIFLFLDFISKYLVWIVLFLIFIYWLKNN